MDISFFFFIFNFPGVISSLEKNHKNKGGKKFLICARPLELIKLYCLFSFLFPLMAPNSVSLDIGFPLPFAIFISLWIIYVGALMMIH